MVVSHLFVMVTAHINLTVICYFVVWHMGETFIKRSYVIYSGIDDGRRFDSESFELNEV